MPKTCCSLDECLSAVTYLTTKRSNAFFPRNLALIYQVSYVMPWFIRQFHQFQFKLCVVCHRKRERLFNILDTLWRRPSRTHFETDMCSYSYLEQLEMIIECVIQCNGDMFKVNTCSQKYRKVLSSILKAPHTSNNLHIGVAQSALKTQ